MQMNIKSGDRKVYIGTVVPYIYDRSQYRYAKVQNALLKLTPGLGRCIIHESCEHAQDDYQEIENVFYRDHSEEDRYECKDQDKDDSGTSGLSNGLGTLYGKFPSAVCREFFFKDPEACKGEDKRKQCAQKDDRVPHLVICHYLENHILTPEE